MRKVIEFFKWDHEGEYQQYFYVVKAEEEAKFIQNILAYLNNFHTKKEFPWANCLTEYLPSQQINLRLNGFVEHLAEYYYIDMNYDYEFTISKLTTKTIETEIKWEEH